MTPIQIVWGKRELTVDERKDGLKSKVKLDFKIVVDAEIAKQVDQYPETQYDANVVDAARIVFETKMNLINAATTHEEVDNLEI